MKKKIFTVKIILWLVGIIIYFRLSISFRGHPWPLFIRSMGCPHYGFITQIIAYETILVGQRTDYKFLSDLNNSLYILPIMIWVPYQYVFFALIIWLIAKTIPTLQELSLYSIRISSNYFDDDIYLVHVTLVGIKYCKIHM